MAQEEKRIAKFHYFGGIQAVHIPNIQIDEWVEKVRKFMQNNPAEQRYRIASGDTTVIGIRYDKDIEIHVCHDYSRVWFYQGEGDESHLRIENSTIEPYTRVAE